MKHQELSDEYKKYAEQIKDGDILNIPTLNIQDYKKISYYLFSLAFGKFESINNEIEALTKKTKFLEGEINRLNKRLKK